MNKADNQFPYFNVTLDKYYDLSDKYVVFDIYKNNYASWFCLDFVNNDVKIGLWNTLAFNADSNEVTHKCEDLGEGWLRVYVNVAALANGADVTNVNKIYVTVNNGNEGVEGNLEFYLDNLHFEALPTFTVTFKDYDGNVISSEAYKASSAVNVPANPTREAVAGECSYVFAGWDVTPPTSIGDLGDDGEVITYTAQWTRDKFTITFDSNGGTAVDPITEDFETVINAPAAPTKSGYTFVGWFDADGNKVLAEDLYKVAGDVTLTAKWESINNPPPTGDASFTYLLIAMVAMATSAAALLLIKRKEQF